MKKSKIKLKIRSGINLDWMKSTKKITIERNVLIKIKYDVILPKGVIIEDAYNCEKWFKSPDGGEIELTEFILKTNPLVKKIESIIEENDKLIKYNAVS
jgi:hypothetical protein